MRGLNSLRRAAHRVSSAAKNVGNNPLVSYATNGITGTLNHAYNAGKDLSRGDIKGALTETGKSMLSGATGGASDLGIAGVDKGKEAAGKVKDAINAPAEAAKKAQEERDALNATALGQNQFGGDEFNQAQQQLMRDQISGTTPQITQEEIDASMRSVVPQINQQFANNPWSTARMKAATAAQQTAQQNLVANKMQRQQSALDALRQESANRTNALTGQAAQVTAQPTWMNTAQNLLGMGSDAANIGANIAKVIA